MLKSKNFQKNSIQNKKKEIHETIRDLIKTSDIALTQKL